MNITPTVERAHKLLRNHPWPMRAKDRIAIARMKQAERLPIGEPFDHDGFTVVISAPYDTEPDVSFLGTFDNKWDEHAVECPNWHYRQNDIYRYFHPEYTEAQLFIDQNGKSGGASKSVARQWAREQVLKDLERCAAPEAWGCVVKVLREGIELGSSSLWGIDVDESDPYFDDIARECLDEAIAEANDALKRLCKAAS